MDDVCRLCSSKECLINIFDEQLKTQVLRSFIYLATTVRIASNDSISKKVCRKCCLTAVELFKFRCDAQVTNEKLKDQNMLSTLSGNLTILPTRHVNNVSNIVNANHQNTIKNAESIYISIINNEILSAFKRSADTTTRVLNQANADLKQKENVSFNRDAGDSPPDISSIHETKTANVARRTAQKRTIPLDIHSSIKKLKLMYPKIILPKEVYKDDINPRVELDANEFERILNLQRSKFIFKSKFNDIKLKTISKDVIEKDRVIHTEQQSLIDAENITENCIVNTSEIVKKKNLKIQLFKELFETSNRSRQERFRNECELSVSSDNSDESIKQKSRTNVEDKTGWELQNPLITETGNNNTTNINDENRNLANLKIKLSKRKLKTGEILNSNNKNDSKARHLEKSGKVDDLGFTIRLENVETYVIINEECDDPTPEATLASTNITTELSIDASTPENLKMTENSTVKQNKRQKMDSGLSISRRVSKRRQSTPAPISENISETLPTSEKSIFVSSLQLQATGSIQEYCVLCHKTLSTTDETNIDQECFAKLIREQPTLKLSRVNQYESEITSTQSQQLSLKRTSNETNSINSNCQKNHNAVAVSNHFPSIPMINVNNLISSSAANVVNTTNKPVGHHFATPVNVTPSRQIPKINNLNQTAMHNSTMDICSTKHNDTVHSQTSFDRNGATTYYGNNISKYPETIIHTRTAARSIPQLFLATTSASNLPIYQTVNLAYVINTNNLANLPNSKPTIITNAITNNVKTSENPNTIVTKSSVATTASTATSTFANLNAACPTIDVGTSNIPINATEPVETITYLSDRTGEGSKLSPGKRLTNVKNILVKPADNVSLKPRLKMSLTHSSKENANKASQINRALNSSDLLTSSSGIPSTPSSDSKETKRFQVITPDIKLSSNSDSPNTLNTTNEQQSVTSIFKKFNINNRTDVGCQYVNNFKRYIRMELNGLVIKDCSNELWKYKIPIVFAVSRNVRAEFRVNIDFNINKPVNFTWKGSPIRHLRQPQLILNTLLNTNYSVPSANNIALKMNLHMETSKDIDRIARSVSRSLLKHTVLQPSYNSTTTENILSRSSNIRSEKPKLHIETSKDIGSTAQSSSSVQISPYTLPESYQIATSENITSGSSSNRSRNSKPGTEISEDTRNVASVHFIAPNYYIPIVENISSPSSNIISGQSKLATERLKDIGKVTQCSSSVPSTPPNYYIPSAENISSQASNIRSEQSKLGTETLKEVSKVIQCSSSVPFTPPNYYIPSAENISSQSSNIRSEQSKLSTETLKEVSKVIQCSSSVPFTPPNYYIPSAENISSQASNIRSEQSKLGTETLKEVSKVIQCSSSVPFTQPNYYIPTAKNISSQSSNISSGQLKLGIETSKDVNNVAQCLSSVPFKLMNYYISTTENISSQPPNVRSEQSKSNTTTSKDLSCIAPCPPSGKSSSDDSLPISCNIPTVEKISTHSNITSEKSEPATGTSRDISNIASSSSSAPTSPYICTLLNHYLEKGKVSLLEGSTLPVSSNASNNSVASKQMGRIRVKKLSDLLFESNEIL